jgi:dephospho-CoA kinase
MKIVGLTGGIGSGKSTVAKMFMDLGVPVYDSDLEAKKLMNSSKELKERIINILGEDAYQEDTLNRSFIAHKVFNDSVLLEQLNGIVHPAVRKHFLDWSDMQKAPYVIQETALIFENGSQDQYDFVVLVTAPLDMRLQRVMERDGVSEGQVLERMKNQMEDAQKLDLAHFCIVNTDLETTKNKVGELHARLVALSSS